MVGPQLEKTFADSICFAFYICKRLTARLDGGYKLCLGDVVSLVYNAQGMT